MPVRIDSSEDPNQNVAFCLASFLSEKQVKVSENLLFN